MKCVSSCFSCLCGARNSSRISPSEPIQVIQPSKEKYSTKHQNEIENGDESLGQRYENGNVNPNFTLGEDESNNGSIGECGDDQYIASSLRAKSLYIEVGKDRLLRVIHVPCNEPELPSINGSLKKEQGTSSDDSRDDKEGSPSGSGESSRAADGGKQDGHDGGGGDDDEEEYWFSKWARKPRFRSIFTKNPDQRPKLNENNNNSLSPEENSKLSVKMDIARAKAAAKRRAWAYNNNGNCESTITQQPTVNPNDEEEFNSIAIVNSIKQQWMKETSSSQSSINGEPANEANTSSCSTVEVQVSVEMDSEQRAQSMKDGVSNPAFQDDDEEGELEEKLSEYNKTENEQNTPEASSSHNISCSNSSGERCMASAKSGSIGSQRLEEDAITSDADEENIGNDIMSPGGVVPSNDVNTVPKKPLIFFVHSISCSSDVWRKQMEFFQQLGYEIIAPDLLGHGLSSTPLNPKYYMFESLVQDLVLIFDHFTKEDVKVVLIGHGYGACLAAMLTRVRLKNIALLITIAGGGPTPLVRRTCCQDSWFSWKCKLFHANRIRGRFDNPELKHILPPLIYKNILSGQVWADGDSSFYRRVTVPTLLVYGMRDKVVTLVEECEMERTIPKSFLELIDSAGHMVMLEEPEKLNKMLCKFIQSWS